MKRITYPWVLGMGGALLMAAYLLQKPAVTGPVAEKAGAEEQAGTPAAVKPVRSDADWQAELPPDFFAPLEPSMPAPAASPPKRGKPPAQDPAARAALSLVGVDSVAEMVWQEAINNPSLPAHERKDLIEDLNEDGFSNKKTPGPVDLPLIKARLAIIDRLMPEAMDKTNADALAEARKDLVNMQAKLSR